jgi:hypothetical protein
MGLHRAFSPLHHAHPLRWLAHDSSSAACRSGAPHSRYGALMEAMPIVTDADEKSRLLKMANRATIHYFEGVGLPNCSRPPFAYANSILALSQAVRQNDCRRWHILAAQHGCRTRHRWLGWEPVTTANAPTDHARKRLQQLAVAQMVIALLDLPGSTIRSSRVDRVVSDEAAKNRPKRHLGYSRKSRVIGRRLDLYAGISDKSLGVATAAWQRGRVRLI